MERGAAKEGVREVDRDGVGWTAAEAERVEVEEVARVLDGGVAAAASVGGGGAGREDAPRAAGAERRELVDVASEV